MKHRIVADHRFHAHGADTLDTSDDVALADWLRAALDDGVDTLVVAGDDATLGALVTAHHERLRDRAEPLVYVPLWAGAMNAVADSVSAPQATRSSIASIGGKLDSLRMRRVPSLRIVDSGRPGARVGFSFGMGAATELLDGFAKKQRRRDAVARSLRDSSSVEADVFIDWEQSAERFGYLLACSLERSWAGVAMGDGPTVRMGSSALELVRGATKVGRLVERAAGGSARSFGRIHIDTNSDYVVDGVVMRSSRPRDVALMPGPQVRVLV